MDNAIYDWPSLLEEARLLFDTKAREVAIAEKERKNYRTDRSGTKYMLTIKDNEIKCVCVTNIRKGRLGNRKKDGTCTVFSVADITGHTMYTILQIAEGFTSREWDRIGFELIHLKEQLK